jgi:hypothetical protein
VNRIAELRGCRRRRVVGRQLFVTRLLSVGTPVPLVGAGIRVEYDDAVIEISVCDINFIGFGIDFCICRMAKASRVIAISLRP